LDSVGGITADKLDRMTPYMTAHPELCHTRNPRQLVDVEARNIFEIHRFSLARSLVRGSSVTRGASEHGNLKFDVVAFLS
jgi:hypothetical protein